MIKQNQNVVIVGVIIVLLVIVGLWYVYTPSTSGDKVTEQISNSGSVPVQGIVTKGTADTLLAKGGNYTCTINTIAEDGSRTSGIIYASDGKTSFDFSTKNAEGLATISHTIRSGSVAYSWADGKTKGVKTTITPKNSIPVLQPSGMVVMINDTAQIESDCHPWIPDVSVFTPPKGITF